jgi:hypothetical protein
MTSSRSGQPTRLEFRQVEQYNKGATVKAEHKQEQQQQQQGSSGAAASDQAQTPQLRCPQAELVSTCAAAVLQAAPRLHPG